MLYAIFGAYGWSVHFFGIVDDKKYIRKFARRCLYKSLRHDVAHEFVGNRYCDPFYWDDFKERLSDIIENFEDSVIVKPVRKINEIRPDMEDGGLCDD